jgi:hypothetical protein
MLTSTEGVPIQMTDGNRIAGGAAAAENKIAQLVKPDMSLRDVAKMQEELQIACEHGHIVLAKFFHGKLGHRFTQQALSSNNWKVLRDAAANGHTQIVAWICNDRDPGTDKVVGTIAGGSPLLNAWRNGHLATARAICDGIHNPSYDDVREFVKDTFIEVCVRGHLGVAMDMAKRYEGLSRPAGFLAACAHGHLELARALTDGPSDLPKLTDAVDALHDACEGGHLEVALWLAEKWAMGVKQMRERGRRGLRGACKWGFGPIVAWMVESGLDDDDFDDVHTLADLRRYRGLSMWLAEELPALRDRLISVVA